MYTVANGSLVVVSSHETLYAAKAEACRLNAESGEVFFACSPQGQIIAGYSLQMDSLQMDTRSRINACENLDNHFRLSDGTCTTSRELLLGMCEDMENAIFIPNDLLPKDLRSNKEYCEHILVDGELVENYGRTAKSALRAVRKLEQDREAVEEKNMRLENLGLYDNQICGKDDRITFRENERRLNNAQVNFMKLLHKMGVVDESLDLA